MIKEESIDILRTAKEALRDLEEHRIEKSVELIDKLTTVSDTELEQLVQKIQVESEIKDSKILFFDVVVKAREIRIYALKAKYAVVKSKYRIVKKFLRHIIELEKTEVSGIDDVNKVVLYKKARLWDRLVLETGFLLFTRNRLQPFSEAIAEELDLFFKQKRSLDRKIKKSHGFEEELKKNLFEKEQDLLQNDSLGNEIKHPVIIPHSSVRIDFKEIFDNYLYISVLGVMSYSLLTKNFFHLIRKFRVMKKIQKFYAKLAFDFDSDFDILVIEYKNIAKSIGKLNKKLRYLTDKAAVIKSKKAIKDLADEYNKFIGSAQRKIMKELAKFELESQAVHDSIIKYVIREREKLQDVLERAEIK